MVKTILETAPLDCLVETINAHVLPMLRGQLALCDEAYGDEVLQQELVSFFGAKLSEIRSGYGDNDAVATILQSCVSIAQASKPTVPQKDRLIRRETGLVRCVIDWCYAYNGVVKINLLWDMFECLPIKISKESVEHDVAELQHQLDQLEALLTVADTLKKYGITSIPLTTYRDLGSAPSGRPGGWKFRDVVALSLDDAQIPLAIRVVRMLADRLSMVDGGE